MALQSTLSREAAWDVLRSHNRDPFHLRHGLTVEGVMRWYARDSGYGEEEAFWGITGLLHDIDFEEYPEEHCVKAVELLRAAGVSQEMIRAVCSHGWGIIPSAPEPVHPMEKILFAADELSGLVWAAALVRPSKSTADLEVSSLKKKYKTPAFAAGCSREVIEKGAALLGWSLDALFEKTILAVRSCETSVNAALSSL